MSFDLITLGEYIKVQGGYAYKSKNFIESSENKVLKIKNVRFGTIDYAEPAYVSDEIAETTKNWKVKEGDVLISMTGSGPNAPQSLVGRVARVWKNEPDAWINQRVGRICLLDNTSIHLDFIFYWLSLPQSQEYLVSNSSGSANQANITGKIIESLPCPKVDYQTSKRIAEIAKKFDEKIILNTQTNQTLEEMAQAIFKSWFVDFDPVKAKMNGELPEGMDAATASLFPEKLVESELDLIPEGWEAGTLDDIAIFQNGYAFKGKDWTDNGFPVVKIGSVKPGIVDLKSCSYVGEDTIEPLERFKLNVGDILVGMTGYVGETGLVPHSLVKPYLNQRVGRLTPITKELYEFLYVIVRNPTYKQFAEAQAQGSAQANVSGKSLMSYPIVIPPESLIEKYSALVYPMLKQKLLFSAQSESLAITRDTLLPKLLSGEIELTQTEAINE